VVHDVIPVGLMSVLCRGRGVRMCAVAVISMGVAAMRQVVLVWTRRPGEHEALHRTEHGRGRRRICRCRRCRRP
jgi:hypothetical protein